MRLPDWWPPVVAIIILILCVGGLIWLVQAETDQEVDFSHRCIAAGGIPIIDSENIGDACAVELIEVSQ